ncbi:MAG: hypothetical protein KTR28_09150 [Micavibrio sp.]|nr:hypothetical protein [Micavibrio sp.]
MTTQKLARLYDVFMESALHLGGKKNSNAIAHKIRDNLEIFNKNKPTFPIIYSKTGEAARAKTWLSMYMDNGGIRFHIANRKSVALTQPIEPGTPKVDTRYMNICEDGLTPENKANLIRRINLVAKVFAEYTGFKKSEVLDVMLKAANGQLEGNQLKVEAISHELDL